MSKAYKIGTVEALRVNSSGRRLYVNLDSQTVQAFGIQPGDILKVRVLEGFRPDNQGGHDFLYSRDHPKKREEGEDED